MAADLTLSRRERRALARRADRVLAKLEGYPLQAVDDPSPTTHVVLASEHTAPILVGRERIVPTLASVGVYAIGLDEALAEIADAADGVRYPVVIAIDGWLQCAWIELRTLARGGDA